ncbi:hypothetical protein [Acidianus brierleyi]|uniref:Uncharacterized protein n=1 Tax=Acidianus brierleyi TaxID=41673 RepID=A0A2U9IGE7_9CREN|nr:hypothetical protein [Acidianus brierleyi]AWR95089.1 hypothetical protein DFR85_11260 [Acidianus brierleyi]
MERPYNLSDCDDIIRLVKESEIEAFNVCEENGGDIIPEEWEFEMVGPKFSILKIKIKKTKCKYKIFINNILYAIVIENKVRKINDLNSVLKLEKSS